MDISVFTKRPFWLGVTVAPWAAPLALFLIGSSRSLANGGVGGSADWRFAAWAFLSVGLPISYLAMGLLAMPYLLWLRKRASLTWLNICIGGTVIGAAAFPAALLLVSGTSSLALALPGAGLGLLSALAFCAVTGPNNSSKPMPLRGTA